MEAGAKTVLRFVALLSIFVLSLAAAPSPKGSLIDPDTSKLKCAEKCGITCAFEIVRPTKFAMCVARCMTTCEIGPNSDVAYSCTRNCVSSMSKFMTTTAKPSNSGM